MSKKIMAMMLVLAVVLGVFAGCGSIGTVPQGGNAGNSPVNADPTKA